MIVVGLDCAPPALVFERYRDAMPHVSSLMERGTWGALRSSEPPITVPAWTCMVSGRDAGELGLYGFRNRMPGTRKLRVATAADLRVKRVWDWLGEHGHRVAPLFVPLTSPPSPVHGVMVSGFMHPGEDAAWCYPRSLEGELEGRFGAYHADVDDFRAHDLERIHSDILAMTDQHFDMARYIWNEKAPDFLMMVEIGVDRFHHAFWRHIDPAHPRYEQDDRYTGLGREYYARLDRHMARLCENVDEETVFLIVSDHGARAMHGGFCINEWLIARGHLVVRRMPEKPSKLSHDDVDWRRTRAWAEGGYYARVFLNVKGREPDGALPANEIESFRARLERELGALSNDEGARIPTLVRLPDRDYREARGFPPDLMVYIDDLRLRAIGSIGHGRLVVTENDTGPDTCNHAWDGIFVMSGEPVPARGPVQGAEIYDITPTILGCFDVPRPPDLLGRNWAM